MLRGLFLVLWALFLLGCSASAPSKNNTQIAEIDTELAVLDLNQHQAENAKTHLLEANSLAPDDALVLAGEGFYDFHIHEASEAAAYYQRAIRVAPNNPEIQNDYGVFLYQTAQFSVALAYFLKAAYNADNLYAGEAFENAAFTESKLGESVTAAAYFKEARLQE